MSTVNNKQSLLPVMRIRSWDDAPIRCVTDFPRTGFDLPLSIPVHGRRYRYHVLYVCLQLLHDHDWCRDSGNSCCRLEIRRQV